MRQIQPFEEARERYLVVGALLHAVEAPNHQIEYWTLQLIGRDVAPHEPFRLRLRDMDLFPRIAVLDLNGHGLQDVLVCEDRDKRPNPWSITFDRGWRVLNEDVGERPECS